MTKQRRMISPLFSKSVGSTLSYRDVTVRVFSAKKSLTTVFGMGTGVTSTQTPPT